MRAVVQRVTRARVTVAEREVGAIGPGLLVLLGVGTSDTAAEGDWLANKIAGLRLFPDETGRMEKSVAEVGGSVLVVSQFTLWGDCQKGRRPSFLGAAPPDRAEPLYEEFVLGLRRLGIPVATGEFGAMMQVELINDGPVTLWLETPARAER